MARIRSIRLEFFRSADVAVLSHRARLTWIGLWTIADDAGRLKGDPRLIKGDLWPLEDDVDVEAIEADLDELERAGRIVRYTVDGAKYIECVNFAKYQKPNRPTPSNLPGHEASLTTHAPLTEDSSPEGRGVGGKREGEGDHSVAAPLLTEPSRYCPEHPSGTARSCGPCKDARLAHERWEKARVPTRALTDAERCARYGPKIDATGHCSICGATLADHPSTAAAAATQKAAS